jgi:hypothetical protein
MVGVFGGMGIGAGTAEATLAIRFPLSADPYGRKKLILIGC